MQLDIFEHSHDVMQRNDVVQALVRHDAGAAALPMIISPRSARRTRFWPGARSSMGGNMRTVARSPITLRSTKLVKPLWFVSRQMLWIACPRTAPE